MEGTNFKDIFRYVLSKIHIVAIIFAVVLIAGEIYTNFMKTPLYQSQTQVVLLNDNSSNTAITATDVQLSNNLVKTYAEIVKSSNVLDQTVKNLNFNYSGEALRNKITVSTVTSTQLITIKVSDENNLTAQVIANEIAKVFKQEIKKIYNIDNVQIVDTADLANAPYNINLIRQTALYAAIGLALGIGVACAMYLLDTSIKDSETVENRVGLTVLGVIPNIESRRK